MKISSKLLTISFLPLATAAVVVVLIVSSLKEVKRAEHDSATCLAMLKAALELSHRVNYYLLYREPRTVREWFTLHDKLRSLSAGKSFGEREQDALLVRIREDVVEMRRIFTALVNAPTDARWRSNRKVFREVESRLTSQLLIRTRYLAANALHLYELSMRESEQVSSRSNILTLILILVSALVMVATLLSINRNIAFSIRKLTDGADSLGSGDLSHRIGFRAANELGQLAAAFDTMAEHLQFMTVSRDDLTREMEERRQAEQALRASEAKFRWLYESDLIGIIFWRTDGTFIEANSSFCHLLGATADDFRRHAISWQDITPPELAMRDHAAMEQIMAWGYCEPYEKEFIHLQTGRRVPVMITGALAAGSRTEGIAFVIDLTERKRAEEALRYSEATLKVAIDATGIGTFDYHTNRGVMQCSELTRTLFGLLPDLPVDYETFVVGIHPEDRERVDNLVRHAIHTTGKLDTEFRTVGIVDGRERWVSARGQVLADAGGRSIRLIGTMLDITERRRSEESLKHALRELERSNQELEQFAYVASHDLQEPLRMVASFVQLLERKYRSRLDDKADEYIGFAVEGAVRMQKLIEGLLAYSRISRGTAFLPVDMNDVFSHAVANMADVIAETGAVVTHDDLPEVDGDETQLVQLFQNLIGNGLKYRSPDSPPTVHVSVRQEGDEWVFSVTDNGIGIDQEYFERIFLIFQRLHTRESYPGTGIGLALCKRIVEHHGGRIWVESIPGAGSSFFFTIPVGGGGSTSYNGGKHEPANGEDPASRRQQR